MDDSADLHVGEMLEEEGVCILRIDGILEGNDVPEFVEMDELIEGIIVGNVIIDGMKEGILDG